MNQFASSAVHLIRRDCSDTKAVLGGRSLTSTRRRRRRLDRDSDDFVQPYALNTTVGAEWQVNRTTTLEVDYIHSYAEHQTGSTDVNLPVSGPISPANPRPVPRFSQVGMVQNFTKSWYDAVEAQMRSRIGGRGSVQVSYTLSRSYLDGVDFFVTMRGTQRTPHERGYNLSDQRHNSRPPHGVCRPSGE